VGGSEKFREAKFLWSSHTLSVTQLPFKTVMRCSSFVSRDRSTLHEIRFTSHGLVRVCGFASLDCSRFAFVENVNRSHNLSWDLPKADPVPNPQPAYPHRHGTPRPQAGCDRLWDHR